MTRRQARGGVVSGGLHVPFRCRTFQLDKKKANWSFENQSTCSREIEAVALMYKGIGSWCRDTFWGRDL